MQIPRPQFLKEITKFSKNCIYIKKALVISVFKQIVQPDRWFHRTKHRYALITFLAVNIDTTRGELQIDTKKIRNNACHIKIL